MGGMVVIEDMAVIDGILGHWTLQKGEEQSRNFDQEKLRQEIFVPK